ncbi:sart-1 family protein [Ophiostoma piceae UAMH 11346]|uniref:Sart-1 family protein n=1 Tax=Ophiostoma piceae (strain UAMH 11346) TaxID=1262450 RepID=S3C4Q0_OPHP1|nr:sart-1 family protein [Ophiostoma piceae UAMH 11346]
MDAATLAEANRLRESMGMKPLPIPGQQPASDDSGSENGEEEDTMATLDGRHAAAYENYQKLQDIEAAKRRREEKAEAVKAAREKAQRKTVLKGKTLADLDFDNDKAEDEGDAKSWLRGQKKRQKKITKFEERQQEEEEDARRRQRRMAGIDSDGEDNDALTGIKVGHDVGDLLDGDDQILTLKDAGVLDEDEEGDELENLGLREKEKLEERLKLKKKRQTYNPLDDDEDGSHTVLGQYDEEIYGKKRKHFTLDPNAILGGLSADGKSASGAAVGTAGGSGTSASAQQQQNLGIDDILAGGPSSDYLDVSEIKVKKPKKKKSKSKSTRQRGGDDDEGLFPVDAAGDAADEDASMDVDDGAGADLAAAKRRKRKALDDSDLLRDEDEFQSALTSQRRDALKKRKRMRPEDLAKQLREESVAPEVQDENDDGTPKPGGLIIDETAEFISNLKRREDREDDAPRKKPVRASSVTAMDDSDDEGTKDVAMQDGDEADIDEDAVARAQREGSTTSNNGVAGLEEEKMINKGMGAALALLKERGILDADVGSSVARSAERNDKLRKNKQFVTQKRVILAQIEEEKRRDRELNRASGPMSQMTNREREEYSRRENLKRELKTSRLVAEIYNESYTPSFELEYRDEQGRELNQKEAFRALSHGFHGQQSGRGKTDKMLKKQEAEKRRMAEGILDASQNVGMSSATAQQLKKRKEAGVRLD